MIDNNLENIYKDLFFYKPPLNSINFDENIIESKFIEYNTYNNFKNDYDDLVSILREIEKLIDFFRISLQYDLSDNFTDRIGNDEFLNQSFGQGSSRTSLLKLPEENIGLKTIIEKIKEITPVNTFFNQFPLNYNKINAVLENYKKVLLRRLLLQIMDLLEILDYSEYKRAKIMSILDYQDLFYNYKLENLFKQFLETFKRWCLRNIMAKVSVKLRIIKDLDWSDEFEGKIDNILLDNTHKWIKQFYIELWKKEIYYFEIPYLSPLNSDFLDITFKITHIEVNVCIPKDIINDSIEVNAYNSKNKHEIYYSSDYDRSVDIILNWLKNEVS